MAKSVKPKIKLFRADLTTQLSLPLAESGIVAGFPSPANDYIELTLDLNKELIKNPIATFYGRVKGNSMIDAGISEGDVVVIDKSIEPTDGKLAVCFLDGEFTIKRIQVKQDCLYLMPANTEFSPILVTEENNFQVWGIITYIIKKT